MKKLLIMWVIIAVSLVGTLTVMGLAINKKNKPYTNLEDELVTSAESYMGQFLNEMPSTSTKVTSEEMIAKNVLNELKVNDEICKGYVVVSKKYVTYEYKPYLKCKNYVTKGYEK
jgi:hypothetical protein